MGVIISQCSQHIIIIIILHDALQSINQSFICETETAKTVTLVNTPVSQDSNA